MEVEWDDGNLAEWIRADEAAKMVGLSRIIFIQQAKKGGLLYCREPKRGRAYWFLRSSVKNWVEFERHRAQWRQRHSRYGKRDLVPIAKIDPAYAASFLLSTKEATARLGVSRPSLMAMVKQGRLSVFQGEPGKQGSACWFSPTEIKYLCKDPERLKRRECYLKHRERGQIRTEGREARPRWYVLDKYLRREKREKVWMTHEEAAAYLGVSRTRMHYIRNLGRVRGERIWGRKKYLPYWFYWRCEVEELRESESHREFREAWEKKYGKRERPYLTVKNEPGGPVRW